MFAVSVIRNRFQDEESDNERKKSPNTSLVSKFRANKLDALYCVILKFKY